MSTLIRWEPRREQRCELNTVREQMDRLFSEAFGRGWNAEEGLTSGAWVPPVDVYETADSLILKADLPEVKKDEIDISIDENRLTIRGERHAEKEVNQENYYRSERNYGTFSRSFGLPPTVNAEKVDATFTGGVLTLTLPKLEEAKPKQIKVKVVG